MQRRQPPSDKRQRGNIPTEPASPHNAGHYAGLHAEDAPYTTTADVRQNLARRKDYPSQKLAPKSAFSYQPIEDFIDQADVIETEDGVIYRQGNDQIYQHNGPPPVPRRASARGGQRTTTAPYELPEHAASLQHRDKRRFHWLFFVGIALLVMIVGYVGLGALGTWWTNHQNDATYGYPRTFQMDAVVGHHDSADHPSHFIAVNLRGHVTIIEIPGGDFSKSVIYGGPTLLGSGQDLTPVTLSFSDVNHDGEPDMQVHILDQTITFLNNGSKFVPPPNLVSRGSNPPTSRG